MVDRIVAGDPAGEETLYQVLYSGARLFLMRRLGSADVEDRLHNLFVIVVETIRRGELREPERLMGFVRTVLHRQLSQEIAALVHHRETEAPVQSADGIRGRDPDPEEQAAWSEKLALMQQALRELSPRETEVLTRSYIREQPPAQIAAEMGMSTAQLYLVRSRAKARLAGLMERRTARHDISRR